MSEILKSDSNPYEIRSWHEYRRSRVESTDRFERTMETDLVNPYEFYQNTTLLIPHMLAACSVQS
jgi:hypothetical protein